MASAAVWGEKMEQTGVIFQSTTFVYEAFTSLTIAMRPFLVILSLFCLFSSKAQQPSFSRLSVENGLSQNSVLCITQDSTGFMWYGTRNGLNKYDSRKIRVYKNEPGNNNSLAGNYITTLLCDHKKQLWAGTRESLHRYNAALDRFERVTFTGNGQKITSKGASALLEDSKGRLWVGSSNSLLLMTNRDKGLFYSLELEPGFPSRSIICIYEDKDGAIWAGTYAGAVRITGEQGRFNITVFRHEAGNAASLSDDQVTSIIQDKRGQLWLGTQNGGLNLYNPATGGFTHVEHSDVSANSLVNNHVRRLLTDNQGKLWIGTQEGISVLDVETGRFSSYVNDPWDNQSLSQNSVHSLYKDKAGTIWIGTFFGGVNAHSPYDVVFNVFNNRSKTQRLNNNVISGLTEDENGNLWIGTEGGGLNYINRQSGAVKYYQHKPSDAGSIGSNLIKTVYRDRDGQIWAGTHGGGLNLYNGSSDRFIRHLYKDNDPQTQGAEYTALLDDSKGIFWVGTETAGLKLFQRKGSLLLPYPEGEVIASTIGNKHIAALTETSDRAIWAGTSQGLYRISSNRIHQLTNNTAGRVAYINCIMQDAAGNVWVGTTTGGMEVYNSAGVKTASYTQQQGLPDNNVLGILEDRYSGTIWASTGNGLARYSPATKRFTVYTEADGLAGNVFNNYSYFRSSNGQLFFGGFNGLTGFNPQYIKDNTTPPATVITGIKLASQQQTAASDSHLVFSGTAGNHEVIQLRYNQNVFTIDFATLNFIKPDKNRYAYQLEGFDKSVNYTSQPGVSYTNVPPGDYTFTVKGANNDGVWSPPVSLLISISPPFWKTWWAYCIYVLLFVTLAFFVTRFFFLRALLKRNQELTQLKLNFFTNISHEIRTHLSLIIGPAEKLLLTAGDDAHEQQQLRTIKNNSESLLQLVNELMDFRKAETGHLSLHVSSWNIVPFAESVFESFNDVSVSRNIRTDFISTQPELHVWFDKEQLKKVLYNLLSNAFKFTPDGGYISVTVEDKQQSVAIRVTDNGKGISKKNIGKLFDNYFQEDDHGKQNTGYGIGLALSKSIVEMHHGGLSVTSEIGDTGERLTCFTVTLLKGNAQFNAAQITDTASSDYERLAITSAERLPETPQPVILPAPADDTMKQTILIVEDNAAIRTFIKEALEKHYHILEGVNGKQGLTMATEHIPDLIVSDVMMPEMDGLEFCSQIKTDARTSHIPVILLTAKTGVANQLSGLQTGADIYLTKPFSIQVLELQIRNLLAGRQLLWKRFQRDLQIPGIIPAEETGAIAETAEKPAALHPMDEAFIQSIVQMVEEHMEDPDFGIALLSKKAAMSQPVLFKKIKAITGMSANDFVKSLRLKRATELLQENRYTVYEVAYMVGYENSKYFSREFKKQFGKTPSEFGKQE